MQGDFLAGATAKDVSLYIVADVPVGGFTWPKLWTQLRGQQVRVTGMLKFTKTPGTPAGTREDARLQRPPDYYYMVLQKTEIQSLDTK